ncbi:hypothetical protein [Streptomyces mirabilis]|uniref:hypothetical protein n=1 Tax=Streptomyces mirabilis TaxID=68239 RepID=UPI00367F9C1C
MLGAVDCVAGPPQSVVLSVTSTRTVRPWVARNRRPKLERALAHPWPRERAHLHIYLNSPYNIAKFRRLGYSEEGIAGGSDRIIGDDGYQ